MSRKLYGEYLLLVDADRIHIDTETDDLLLLKPVTAGNRSRRIFARVQLICAGGIGNLQALLTQIPEDTIYDIMGDISQKIAMESLCIEKLETVLVSSSTIAEPDAFFRGKLLQLDTNLSFQLVEIDVEDFDNVSRYTFSGAAQTPLYYKRWNGTITLYPSVTSDYYPLYYYAIPQTTPSRTIDPETPVYMDKAVEYGTIAEVAIMAGKNDIASAYEMKFQNELQKTMINHSKTHGRILELQSHE
jgi:hypothetical protein